MHVQPFVSPIRKTQEMQFPCFQALLNIVYFFFWKYNKAPNLNVIASMKLPTSKKNMALLTMNRGTLSAASTSSSNFQAISLQVCQ
jgi:hypothetical protein